MVETVVELRFFSDGWAGVAVPNGPFTTILTIPGIASGHLIIAVHASVPYVRADVELVIDEVGEYLV